MKRFTVFGMAFLLFANVQLPLHASTVVLEEDFESPEFTIGSDPTAGTVLTWQKLVSSPGVYGTDAVATIAASTITGGGSQSLELQDNSASYSLDFSISSSDLENYNSGTGIQKGSVQFDFSSELIQPSGWYFEMVLYDDFTVGAMPTDDIATIVKHNNSGCVVSVYSGSAILNKAADDGDFVSGGDYTFTADFDVATRALAVNVIDKSTGLSKFTVNPVAGTLVGQDAGFKGVRGMRIYLGPPYNSKMQIDNLVFTDLEEPTTSVQDWMQR